MDADEAVFESQLHGEDEAAGEDRERSDDWVRGRQALGPLRQDGLVPELASSHWLVARCGFGAASWLALSGTTVLGEEAHRLGLVDRVTTPDSLLDEATAVAGELAANPPTQLRLIKQLLTANAVETDRRGAAARARRADAELSVAGARGSGAGVPREASTGLPLTPGD